MAVALHTDPATLPRSRLDARLQDVIRAVQDKQRESAACGASGAVVLDDGTRFLPDGQDAKAGSAGMTIGIVAAVFGLAFTGMLVDGSQAEPWMRFAGPGLLGTGAFLIWSGRAKKRVASAAPRMTGAYLLDDVLLHVATYGCRLFPVERIRSFEYRAGGDDRSSRTLVSFVGDDGVERQDVLFYEDARAPLDAWLARVRS